MKREIRIPKQKRSIEKKNKIIKAAYKIFNEKGYNNTNTAEIAKEAGLSTGCLYDYFIDKKDIFLEVLRLHTSTAIDAIFNKLLELPQDEDLLIIIKKLIYIIVEVHNHHKGFHQEVAALSYSNIDVKEYLKIYEQDAIISKISDYLKGKNINLKNQNEKLLLLLNTVDSLAHELIYNQNADINNDVIIDECAHMIEYLLKS